LQEKLNELSSQVRDLSSALHELSHELHPLKLEQLGLVTSIQSLCKEVFENHSLKIEFLAEPTSFSVPPEIALCLYRIVQESLRNIIKHSGAKEATICMTSKEDELHLEITDCGKGFDTTRLGNQGGLGFISMNERLRLVGGELSVDSQPFQGTTLRVRVPRHSPESQQKSPSQSGKM
jgi:signal transduction histidine kinase